MRAIIVAEDEDEAEIHLGECAAVDGLFVDEALPPREILTLRGCAPGPVPGHLGRAWMEGCRDDGQPVRWWDLHDAEILTVTANAGDAALVDLVVGAAVRDAPGSQSGGGGPLARFHFGGPTRRSSSRAPVWSRAWSYTGRHRHRGRCG